MAQPQSLRPVPPPRSTDPTVIELLASGTTTVLVGMVYSASVSPFLQGVEIRQPWQLTQYTQLKIRGNSDFTTTLNGVAQTQQFFNETLANQNLGTAGTGSLVSLDTAGLLGLELLHRVEKRDLGQTDVYSDNSPFVDPDPVETNATVIIRTSPSALVVPTALVQANSGFTFDGTIEAFDIRRVADRTSIDLPFVIRGPKGSLSIEDEKRQGVVQQDFIDLRDGGAAPYLDGQETFGNIGQPSAFSDATTQLAPFSDTTQNELFYSANVLDAEIRTVLVSGFVSGSLTYTAARSNDLIRTAVVMRHGFTFSQNDNFGYDSIAFGGLKK